MSLKGLVERFSRRSSRRALSARTAASVTVRRAGENGFSYYGGLNEQLLSEVPDDAIRILEVGCAEGRLGEALLGRKPERIIFGIELEPEAAAKAARHLEKVFVLDVERDLPDLDRGSLDLILFGDVLEHLHDPCGVLRRYGCLLAPNGKVLCSVPNVQHHSILSDLLRSEWQYQDAGLLDRTHLRFFTWASFTKLFLDAGLAPKIVGKIASAPSRHFMADLSSLLGRLGVDPALAADNLAAYQWIIEGKPLEWDDSAAEEPLSFIACVNDEAQLAANLAASPCFRGSSPHEIITVRNADSAAAAFEMGLKEARNRILVLVHQDVYLPEGWPRRFMEKWRQAEVQLGPIGVAGVYGASFDPDAQGSTSRAGFVVDRQTLLKEPSPLPAVVQTLDELLLALPRDSPLKLDDDLGWHFYGADLAMQASAKGLRAVVLDAPCFHNSLNNYILPKVFKSAGQRFRKKWIENLPVATPCIVILND